MVQQTKQFGSVKRRTLHNTAKNVIRMIMDKMVTRCTHGSQPTEKQLCKQIGKHRNYSQTLEMSSH